MTKISLTIKSEDNKFFFEQEISLVDSSFIINYFANKESNPNVSLSIQPSNPQILVNDTKLLLDLLEKYQPKSNVEKFVVFAEYLTVVKSEQPFSEVELKELFTTANFKVPENFKRDLGIAVGRGVLFKLKDQDLFIATPKTKKELDLMIEKQSIDESTLFKKKKRIRGLTQRAELNNGIKSIPLTGNLKGLNIKYKDLRSGSDRILWVIAHLKNNAMESVSIKDIEFISDKLGNVVKSKYFAMYNKPNIENGYVAKVDNKFIITEEGERYISTLAV